MTATAWPPKSRPAASQAALASSMPLRVSGVPPDLEMTSTGCGRGRVVASCEHRVHAGGVGVVEEEDRQAGVTADGFGDELRAERRAADADEQDLLEHPAAGRSDGAGVDFRGEVLERGERSVDGFLQIWRGRQVRVAQPVVADHAAFIGVGDGAAFERLHVGEGLLDFRLHGAGKSAPISISERSREKPNCG